MILSIIIIAIAKYYEKQSKKNAGVRECGGLEVLDT
jgi:hypothetical protein